MHPNRPTTETLQKTMKKASSIRNVCILAHVDHGKTTIADSLLATNALVSNRMAGEIRYLDDRVDEQDRGITMKSSAISLYYLFESDDMILNLIDTPGHIDFSTEVSAAVCISDGALIVVDIVEGVCAQTRDAIKQAYDERVKMILILNKIDRLVHELNRKPEVMFQNILRAIEDCNVIIAEFCKYDAENVTDPDEFLFSPDKGNVIFGSAKDGWAVTTKSLSHSLCNSIEGETPESLKTKIWNFDCYVHSKTRRIITGAILKNRENVFTQLFLKTIYFLYFTFLIERQQEKLGIVIDRLNVKMTRDMYHRNPRQQIKAILQSWSPIAAIIMQQCYDVIPSPANLDARKLHCLVSRNRYFGNQEYNKCVEEMLNTMKDPNSKTCIVYISKMFSVNKMFISENKPKVFVPPRRRIGQAADVEKVITECTGSTKHETEQVGESSTKTETKDNTKESSENTDDIKEVKNGTSEKAENGVSQVDKGNEIAVIALGRIFGGTFEANSEIYLLPSDYYPSKSSDLKKIRIGGLYMMLGRQGIPVEEISFGNICGIGGLDDLPLRMATLSSSLFCLPLTERIQMEPIVRNTVEPVNLTDLPKLRQGLKHLAQSDSCVQVVMQETGEHVLVTAGDVHLAKCLEDLRTKFIDFKINVSKPTVLLRETISRERTLSNSIETTVDVTIQEVGISFQAMVLPIPDEILSFLTTNYKLLQMVQEHRHSLDDSSQHTKGVIEKLKEKLTATFSSASDIWRNVSDKVWSVGKSKDTINVLINYSEDYLRNIFVNPDENDPRSAYDHFIINGFEMCCRAGPICEEAITNCCFVISNYKIDSANKSSAGHVQAVANVLLNVKNALREAFSKQEQRLVEPIFATDIDVNINILGKVYTVLGKRHGKVLEAVGMDQEEKAFRVKAQIPAIESDGFANEIRKASSGCANPTLWFSHYEVIDADPYFEGDEDACADDMRANKLMNEIRRRKGLLTDEQIVVHAEKQRTLNKKK